MTTATRSRKGERGIVIGRLNAFEDSEGGSDAPVETFAVSFEDFSTRARMISRGEQRGENVDIEGADILVAGGRGAAQGSEQAARVAANAVRIGDGAAVERNLHLMLLAFPGPQACTRAT